MPAIDTIKIILTIVSGVCWTIVYIDGIRIGFRHKSYAIPFYALALNFAWESLYTFFGFRTNGVTVQNVFNAVWLAFDVGILYTYFKFGRKYFPWSDSSHLSSINRPGESGVQPPHSKRAFIAWSVLGIITAFGVQYAFRREFGVAKGAAYSAFPQNLIMSILFIGMLVTRGNREGQSLTIAVNKWLGTLAPTILYGAIGEGGFPRGSFLILIVGLLCSVFDLIYIVLLARAKPVPLQLDSRRL
ncbi:MAG TPA: hypothetical protein VN696_16125 [Pyrinomonadaceae bacterium]|nr:hypothetical protein [Pyrinomonadaceae bacterium]